MLKLLALALLVACTTASITQYATYPQPCCDHPACANLEELDMTALLAQNLPPSQLQVCCLSVSVCCCAAVLC